MRCQNPKKQKDHKKKLHKNSSQPRFEGISWHFFVHLFHSTAFTNNGKKFSILQENIITHIAWCNSAHSPGSDLAILLAQVMSLQEREGKRMERGTDLPVLLFRFVFSSSIFNTKLAADEMLKEPWWLKLKKTKMAQTRFFQCEHESKFKREFTNTCASKIAQCEPGLIETNCNFNAYCRQHYWVDTQRIYQQSSCREQSKHQTRCKQTNVFFFNQIQQMSKTAVQTASISLNNSCVRVLFQ